MVVVVQVVAEGLAIEAQFSTQVNPFQTHVVESLPQSDAALTPFDAVVIEVQALFPQVVPVTAHSGTLTQSATV